MLTAFYNSQIGLITITGTAAGILSVGFVEDDFAGSEPAPEALQPCIRQLDEYFQGTRTAFSVATIPQGTAFQQRVWRQLSAIPFGATMTYQQLAEALDIPRGAQAVGRANGANRLAMLVPCHRVIGQAGKLTGYAGGLWRKAWLLRHEGALLV